MPSNFVQIATESEIRERLEAERARLRKIAGLDQAKLRGATYADARLMHLRQRDLTTKNGQVGTLAESESIGIGVRVLANGAWGLMRSRHSTSGLLASPASRA